MLLRTYDWCSSVLFEREVREFNTFYFLIFFHLYHSNHIPRNFTPTPSNTNNRYSISAVTSYSDVELQEGVPIQDHITRHQYLYYSYEINSNADGLKIVVSPSSGDPDLVCSTNSTNTQPSMSDSGSFIFKARDFGLDQIHLGSSDINGVSTLYCAVYVVLLLLLSSSSDPRFYQIQIRIL